MEDKKRQKITLQKIISEKHNDYFLKIDSQAKRAKERSMNRRFHFLRTSLRVCENLLWDVYNIIRETEYSFRTLKTDLDLRPICHKKDTSTMAHLHPELLAYRVVNTVRYQLKRKQADVDVDQQAQTQAENTDEQTEITPVI